jgi:peroxiredoxin
MGVFQTSDTAAAVDFSLMDVNGQPVRLSEFSGKVVLLHFWTTWCPSCVKEMPAMQKLHARLKVKDFALVAVSLRESAAKVKDFFRKRNLTFTALLDPEGEVSEQFAIRSIPTSFILDTRGRIIGQVAGPRDWDSEKAVVLFEYLMDRDKRNSSIVRKTE